MKEKFETKHLLLKLKKNEKGLPDELFKHDHFETLEIISEGLEKIDERIQKFKKLKIFSVTSPALTALHENLFSLETLSTIKIKNTQIKKLPEQLPFQCPKLIHLVLSNNQLQQLPSWICQLSELQSLDLSRNHLTTLPTEFSNLKKLKRLILDSNQIKMVPPSLLSLKGLNHLSMDQNPLNQEAKNQLHEVFNIWF